jgi:hypothetical protein
LSAEAFLPGQVQHKRVAGYTLLFASFRVKERMDGLNKKPSILFKIENEIVK